MGKKTQTERVYDYISQFGSITSWQAYADLGITQLGARIWELEKRAGIKFARTQVSVTNRYGEKIRIVKYSFLNNPQNQKM